MVAYLLQVLELVFLSHSLDILQYRPQLDQVTSRLERFCLIRSYYLTSDICPYLLPDWKHIVPWPCLPSFYSVSHLQLYFLQLELSLFHLKQRSKVPSVSLLFLSFRLNLLACTYQQSLSVLIYQIHSN